jgi:hypothetical protein
MPASTLLEQRPRDCQLRCHERDSPHAAAHGLDDHAASMTDHHATRRDGPARATFESPRRPRRMEVSLSRGWRPKWPWRSKHAHDQDHPIELSTSQAGRYLVQPVRDDSGGHPMTLHALSSSVSPSSSMVFFASSSLHDNDHDWRQSTRSRSGGRNAIVAWHRNPHQCRNYCQDLSYFRAKALVMQKRMVVDADERKTLSTQDTLA